MFRKQIGKQVGHTSQSHEQNNVIEQRGINNNIINDIIFFGPTTKSSKHNIIINKIIQPGQASCFSIISSPPEMGVKVIRSGTREHLITVVTVIVAGRRGVIVVLIVLLPFFARPTVLLGFPIIVVIAVMLIVIVRRRLPIPTIRGRQVFETVVVIVEVV